MSSTTIALRLLAAVYVFSDPAGTAAQSPPPRAPSAEAAPAVPAMTSDSNPLAAVSRCYIGPVTIKVIDDQGQPVANAGVGLFGAMWKVNDQGKPVRTPKDWRTGEDGTVRAESVQECEAPTFVYAFETKSGKAGLTWIEDLANLKSPQTITIRPARRIKGQVRGTADECPSPPEILAVFLAPVYNGQPRTRHFKFVRNDPGEFEFLLPPGDYHVQASAAGATTISVDFSVTVVPGCEMFHLGTIEPCKAWRPDDYAAPMSVP